LLMHLKQQDIIFERQEYKAQVTQSWSGPPLWSTSPYQSPKTLLIA